MKPEFTLSKLQDFFWATMREDVVIETEINDRFLSHTPLDGIQRMAIYRRMFWARQVAALEESFPRTRTAIGEGEFRSLVRSYLLEHPSRDPRLEMLGQDLPAFLYSRAAASAAREAALEWAEMAVLLRPDEDTRAPSVGVSPALAPDKGLSCLAAMELVPDVTGGGTIVWRREFAAWQCTVEPDEWKALHRARAGAPLSDVCEEFSMAADPAVRAAAVLHGWLKRGWILGARS